MIANYFIVIVFSLSKTERLPDTAIIRWSQNYQLRYADFKGDDKATHTNKQVLFDTAAMIHYSIKWKVKIDSGKNRISAYAVVFPETSYMSRKEPDVLKHEQGHFDIAEIYAKRLEQQVNDAGLSEIHEFFIFLAEAYKQVSDECSQEQDKYDAWTKNTPGRDYYYKWIDDQLRDLKVNK